MREPSPEQGRDARPLEELSLLTCPKLDLEVFHIITDYRMGEVQCARLCLCHLT